MGFFGSQRSQKTSPVEQIESLNTRLEKARLIVSEGRIFPVINKESYYVVQAPQGKGFYFVSSDGCCNDGQHRADLLEGYCENTGWQMKHLCRSLRMGKLPLPASWKPRTRLRPSLKTSDISSAEEPPVTKPNGRTAPARSRKGAAEAIITAEGLYQSGEGSPVSRNGAFGQVNWGH